MRRTSRPPLSAEVRAHLGRPCLFLNGRLVQPAFYSLTDYPGGRWTWEEMPRRNLSLFAEAGFHLFQADLMLEHIWTAERSFDIGPARSQIRGILQVCPAAGVVLRLHVNAPPWWNAAHPEECVCYADGPVDSPPTRGIERPLDRDLERSCRQSLASVRWRLEAGDRVRRLLSELATTPEGDALIGIHIADGVFGEWAYFGFISHEPDTGLAMTACFRAWLAAKYRDDASLRAAWRDPSASVEGATVPGMPERRACRAGVFRDPEIERRMIDYSECQQAAVAESILHFCSVAKRSWPRALLTGVFYGYIFSQFGRQAAGGHLDIARILKSPDIDYLSGPQTYQPFTREVGGTGQSRGLPESCALHGKLWMDEMDQPTHLGAPGDPGYHCTLPDALALLRRNVAHPLLRGHGLWYYDFGPRFSSGWWDDPALIAEIRRLKDLFDARLARPYESPADVLLVCDTSVFHQTGPSFEADPVSEPSLDQLSAAMYRSGVSFHMVYLADLEAIDWSRYRAVVFANTWLLTPGQKAFIRDRVACSGRHLIWVYAPGYSDGARLDAEHVSEVVGFRVEPAEADPSRGVRRAAGLFPLPAPLSPVFVVRDPAAEVTERFDGSDLPAISRRRFDDSDSWFFASPPIEPELLRRLFRESGAHIYGDAGDVIVAGWGILLVHAVEPGPRSLLLRSGRRVEVELPARSTTLIDCSTGAVLF